MAVANEGWIGLDDHSKWAVSLPLEGSQRSQKLLRAMQVQTAAIERVSCLSDLNRELSQVNALRICCTCTVSDGTTQAILITTE